MKKPAPPKLFLHFLRWFCHPELHPFVEGDLLELFQENVRRMGHRKAKWLFAWDVLKLFRPDIIRPLTGHRKPNYFGMFENYLKVGTRNILKYKTFSFINVFGLAVAMSVCLLIILMLADQKSYDQFHARKDRIYRILMHPATHSRPYATAPFPISETLKAQYPIIEGATYLRRGVGGDAVYDENFAEIKGYFTDASFFKIFSFPLEKGNPLTALCEPNSMVITKAVAHQLFGHEDPIGKTIDFADRGIDFFSEEARVPVNWGSYTVTGVLDNKRDKSHLKFDVLMSSSSLQLLYKEDKIDNLSDNWSNYYQSYIYVLLKRNATQDDLEVVLNNITSIKYANDESLQGSRLIPQSLAKITPGLALGNAPTIRMPVFVYYIFSALALVIMVLACLNYTSLTTARSLTRSKEIGVRKVNGAKRKDLILQFLSESMITALLALTLAYVLLFFVKSAFLGLWINQYLDFDLNIDPGVVLISVQFALMVGFIAGIFPALNLSRYRPIKSLKNLQSNGKDRIWIRKILTITQFATSLIFIVTSIVVFNQFRHFMQHEYGFDAGNVVNINLQSNDFALVKSALNGVPGVSSISGCAYLPATSRNDNISLKKQGIEETQRTIDLSVDEDFIQTLKINLIAGQNLPTAGVGDNTFILVNEETVKAFGYDNPRDILGQSLETTGGRALQVVGVVENFTFHLLFNGRPTGPVIMRNDPEKFKFLSVKITTGNENETIQRLEEKWKTLDPIHPFEFQYYEDKLANNNQSIFDIVSIIGFIAFLAITIACLGLLGMAIYTTERRTKEVGIRKVLGAGNFMLAYLLSREFLMILTVSILVAAPLSYVLNNFWLNFLVARVQFGFGTVLLGSLLLLFLGIITIAPQTVRISGRNPADILRNE